MQGSHIHIPACQSADHRLCHENLLTLPDAICSSILTLGGVNLPAPAPSGLWNTGGGCVRATIGPGNPVYGWRYAEEIDIDREGAGERTGGEYGGGGVSRVAVDVFP
jgi:hypothetical protein